MTELKVLLEYIEDVLDEAGYMEFLPLIKVIITEATAEPSDLEKVKEAIGNFYKNIGIEG